MRTLRWLAFPAILTEAALMAHGANVSYWAIVATTSLMVAGSTLRDQP